jgi:membrane-associated phospholipid phosphatase
MIERGVRDARRFAFEPVDLLTSGFAAALEIAGLLRRDVLQEKSAVLRMAAIALIPIAGAWWRARGVKRWSLAQLVIDFQIIVCVVLIFDGLGPLIVAVNPHDQDAALIALDRTLFGVDPTVFLEGHATPLVSDVLTICYALYYFHPIILAGLIWADDKRKGRLGDDRDFRRFGFTVVFVFFVSYLGYFVVPATGPRFNVQHQGPLPRGAVSAAIDQTLDKLEKNKRDCFPSGHTMIVLTVLIEAWRRSRKTFLGFLPFAIGLLAATVYCRYHYVVDVLAGTLLTPVCVALAWWWMRPRAQPAIALP